MTIKKPVKKSAEPKKPSEGGSSDAPASGGAAIASRLKLDAPDPELARKAASASKGTKYAVIFGLIALVVVGILTYTLWKHWEFLMPA